MTFTDPYSEVPGGHHDDDVDAEILEDFDIDTVVNEPLGPTNTGSGAQHNHFHAVREYVEARRRRLYPQAIPEDFVQYLWARFVPPGSFPLAKQILFSPAATVLLGGRPGSGRQTAAHMLLCPPGAQTRALRRLPTEPDAHGEVLDPTQIAANDLLLLDLTAIDQERFDAHQYSLPAFCAALRDKGARLVIVVSPEQENWLTDQLERLLVRITPPDPREVFIKHLPVRLRPYGPAGLRVGDLDRQLDTMPMRDIARLARLIEEAARTRGTESDLAGFLESALPALHNHVEAITTTMREADGPTRALMLAAAMLEGGPVDLVHHAEQHLLRLTGYPTAETPQLERRDLFARLQDLAVTVDEQRLIGFTKLDYGTAILTHVWDRHPHLHAELRTWTQHLVGYRELSDDNLNSIAERYIYQSLRTGRIHDLLTTAEQWAVHRRIRVRRLAYTVLATSATHDRAGGTVRQRIYEWAQNRNLNPDLARTLIAVCAVALGRAYPDRTLVRLRLLTRHSDPAVRADARQAVVELAADPGFFRRALAKITESGAVDAELFLSLIDPHRLTEHSPPPRPLVAASTVQSQLMTGWRFAMTAGLAWAGHANAWLQACADDPRRDPLLDVLADACAPRADLCAELFVISRHWSAGSAEPDEHQRRCRAVRELEYKIDRARGLGFLCPGYTTPAEETGL